MCMQRQNIYALDEELCCICSSGVIRVILNLEMFLIFEKRSEMCPMKVEIPTIFFTIQNACQNLEEKMYDCKKGLVISALHTDLWKKIHVIYPV